MLVKRCSKNAPRVLLASLTWKGYTPRALGRAFSAAAREREFTFEDREIKALTDWGCQTRY